MRLAMPFIESPMSIARVVRAELIPPSVLIVAQNTHSSFCTDTPRYFSYWRVLARPLGQTSMLQVASNT